MSENDKMIKKQKIRFHATCRGQNFLVVQNTTKCISSNFLATSKFLSLMLFSYIKEFMHGPQRASAGDVVNFSRSTYDFRQVLKYRTSSRTSKVEFGLLNILTFLAERVIMKIMFLGAGSLVIRIP